MSKEAGTIKNRILADFDAPAAGNGPEGQPRRAGPPPLPGAKTQGASPGAPLPTLSELLAPVQKSAPSLPLGGGQPAQTDADWARAAAERWSSEPLDHDDDFPIEPLPVAVPTFAAAAYAQPAFSPPSYAPPAYAPVPPPAQPEPPAPRAAAIRPVSNPPAPVAPLPPITLPPSTRLY